MKPTQARAGELLERAERDDERLLQRLPRRATWDLLNLQRLRTELASARPLSRDDRDALMGLIDDYRLPIGGGSPKGPRNARNVFKQCAAILMQMRCEEYLAAHPRRYVPKPTRKRIARRAIEVLLQDPPDQIMVDEDLFDEVVNFKGRITEQAREYVDRHFPNARELMRDLPPPSYRDGDRVYKAAK